jgi:hypothetical protein
LVDNDKECPKCGSLNVIKIVYGPPTNQMILSAKEDKIKLGGCSISGSAPKFHCKDCKNEWR